MPIKLAPKSKPLAVTTKSTGHSPTAHKPPETRLIPSPLNGVVAPVDKRWQAGQSGNPAGRPRVVRSAYEQVMMEPRLVRRPKLDANGKIVVDGKGKMVMETVQSTRAEAIARNLADNAEISFRFGVGAAQELRKVVEPETEEEAKGLTDREFIRNLAIVMQASIEQSKKVEAIEV